MQKILTASNLFLLLAIVQSAGVAQADQSCATGIRLRSIIIDMDTEIRMNTVNAIESGGAGVGQATSAFVPGILPPPPIPSCSILNTAFTDFSFYTSQNISSNPISVGTSVRGFNTIEYPTLANGYLSPSYRRAQVRSGGEDGKAFYFVWNTQTQPLEYFLQQSFVSRIATSTLSLSGSSEYTPDPAGGVFLIAPSVRIRASVSSYVIDTTLAGQGFYPCFSVTLMPCEICRQYIEWPCDGDGDPFNDPPLPQPPYPMQTTVHALKASTMHTSSGVANIWNGVLRINSDGSSTNLGFLSQAQFSVVNGSLTEVIVDIPGATSYSEPGVISTSLDVDAFSNGEADLDRSGAVDWNDRRFILSLLGKTVTDVEYDARTDYILDGEVLQSDIAAYAPAWHSKCHCPGDYNVSGTVGFQDFSDFFADYSSGSFVADYNGDGILGFQDIADFLAVLLAPTC